MLRIYVCLLPFEMLLKRSFTSYFVCYGLLSFTFAALFDFNFPFVYLWVFFLLISLSHVTPHSIFLVYLLKVLVDLSLVFFLFFLLAFKFIFLGFSVWYCLFFALLFTISSISSEPNTCRSVCFAACFAFWIVGFKLVFNENNYLSLIVKFLKIEFRLPKPFSW